MIIGLWKEAGIGMLLPTTCHMIYGNHCIALHPSAPKGGMDDSFSSTIRLSGSFD